MRLGHGEGYTGYNMFVGFQRDAEHPCFVVEGRGKARHRLRVEYPFFPRSKIMRGDRDRAFRDALDLYKRLTT